MIDGTKLNKEVQEIAEKTTQEGVSKPEAPDGDDVSRFEKAMENGGAEQPGQEEAPNVPDPSQNDGPKSLGDKVLEGMEKVKASYDEEVDKIEKLVDKPETEPLSVQDAIKLQFDLMKLNLQVDVASKTVDKTSQGVQTLFKNQ